MWSKLIKKYGIILKIDLNVKHQTIDKIIYWKFWWLNKVATGGRKCNPNLWLNVAVNAANEPKSANLYEMEFIKNLFGNHKIWKIKVMIPKTNVVTWPANQILYLRALTFGGARTNFLLILWGCSSGVLFVGFAGCCSCGLEPFCCSFLGSIDPCCWVSVAVDILSINNYCTSCGSVKRWVVIVCLFVCFFLSECVSV